MGDLEGVSDDRADLAGTPADAVACRRERARLHELVTSFEAEHGPSAEEEIRRKRETLRRARCERTPDPGDT